MLQTETAITLSSPPRHSQGSNGGFIISVTFDHKLAKFGMYILSCGSQQTNLWLRFSEFDEVDGRPPLQPRECVLWMLLLSCINARWSCRILFEQESRTHKTVWAEGGLLYFAFSLCFMSDYNTKRPPRTQRGHHSLCGTPPMPLL